MLQVNILQAAIFTPIARGHWRLDQGGLGSPWSSSTLAWRSRRGRRRRPRAPRLARAMWGLSHIRQMRSSMRPSRSSCGTATTRFASTATLLLVLQSLYLFDVIGFSRVPSIARTHGVASNADATSNRFRVVNISNTKVVASKQIASRMTMLGIVRWDINLATRKATFICVGVCTV